MSVTDHVLRSLDRKGTIVFRTYLQELRGGTDKPPPVEELSKEPYSHPAATVITIDPDRRFETRYEMGHYLVGRFNACTDSQAREDTEANPGVWAWLALVWFDQLCPRDSEGKRAPRADENYIPLEILETSAKSQRRLAGTWGRHAVRTSYLLVREYGDLVDFVLSNKLEKRGELTEQLTGRAYMVACRPVVETMVQLYRDTDKGTPKRGASGKGAGSARRFFKLMLQLMLNYDLYDATPGQILAMLPKEFGRFTA